MADPGFWNDQAAAREVIDDANKLKQWSEPWNELNSRAESLSELLEMLEAESDPDMLAEVQRDAATIGPALGDLELRNMLQAIASPMMAAPALAALMGLDATLVLVTLISSTALWEQPL